MISNTGIPASFYLYSEESLAKQIERQFEVEQQE
jgi:hypothetical protein